MANKPFTDLITFSRAGTATYFNSSGVLTTANTNEARYDYNPSTLVARGLLIEESKTNYISYSQNFENAYWDATQLVTVTANTAVSPSSLTDADSLTEIAATSNTHHIHDATGPFAPVVSTSYTMSCFVKQGAVRPGRYVQLVFWSGGFGSTAYMNFDLQTGTVGSGGAAISASSITSVGNGWYRISATAPATATTLSGWQLAFVTSTTAARTESYTVTAGSEKTVYIYGAQVEAGLFASSYIPTTSASVTRASDYASIVGTNFLSLYNPSQGTLYAEFSFEGLSSTTGQRILTIDDGSVSNQIHQGASSINGLQNLVTVSGPNQVSGTTPTTAFVAGTVYKCALAYQLNNTNAAVNGSIGTNDTVCTIPTGLTTIRLAGHPTTGAPSSIWFKTVKYYPARLSDANLQSITT